MKDRGRDPSASRIRECEHLAQLIRTAARLRPGPLTTPATAAKLALRELALRELARRAQSLSAKIQRWTLH